MLTPDALSVAEPESDVDTPNVEPATELESVAVPVSVTGFGKTTVVELLSDTAPVSEIEMPKIEPATLKLSEALPVSLTEPPGTAVLETVSDRNVSRE
jgi:hypothetical protein